MSQTTQQNGAERGSLGAKILIVLMTEKVIQCSLLSFCHSFI